MSFALQGFATVVREGIIVSQGQTVSLDIPMKVSALSESVTVTGESPVVDTKTVVRQDVIRGSLIAELPTARNVQNVAILIPGMAVTGRLMSVASGEEPR